MCKLISSDVVIGNLIIEAVKREYNQISFEEIYRFDKLISDALKGKDYVTQFSGSSLSEFFDNYPFFVSLINDECMQFLNLESNRDSVMKRLIRHFRIGLPNTVIAELTTASKVMFG